jgi:1,2-dihydroxy-3-keto-5-methylthiopentene dioxygenase
MRTCWLEEPNYAWSDASTLFANGVSYLRLRDNYRQELDEFKVMRGYVAEDVVELNPQTPGYQELCEKFLREHSHADDEVRFVLEGEGLFDIRSTADRWLRVLVEKGDLIVVPQGRHHRFMLTQLESIRTIRLFKDQTGWVPVYR